VWQGCIWIHAILVGDVTTLWNIHKLFFKTDFRKKKKREICERLVGFFLLTKAGL